MIFQFQLKEEIPLSLRQNEVFELLYHRVPLMPKGVFLKRDWNQNRLQEWKSQSILVKALALSQRDEQGLKQLWELGYQEKKCFNFNALFLFDCCNARKTIALDPSSWVKGMARERVQLANDPHVQDWSFNTSTVARLVLGGSRATYRVVPDSLIWCTSSAFATRDRTVRMNDIRDAEKVLVWQQIIVAFYLTRIETIYYLYCNRCIYCFCKQIVVVWIKSHLRVKHVWHTLFCER